MGKFKIFCILALVVLFAVPAYAEVQNVKVSGDLSARWILRNDYDLAKGKGHATTDPNSGEDFWMSTAEVEVDADLTDNVATVVRLANQKDWGDRSGMVNGTATDGAMNIIVDLANVTFKELVYSPLTVTIGRQDLWFGKGFIVGAKQRDPNNAITAKEYTVINSFDAVKATLDFDPWKIDAIYSVIEEKSTNRNDDVFLTGANIGYKFDSYNGEAEAYLFRKDDRSGLVYPDTSSSIACKKTWINTWGIRGSLEPVANATIAAEGAIQYGRYSATTSEAARKVKANALDFSGDYKFKDIKWTPKLGVEYIRYSGEADNATTNSGTFKGWNVMYRGKFDSAIREFQNVYYATCMREDNHATTGMDADAGNTNEQQIIVYGSLNPTNSLKVDGRLAWFRFIETPKVAAAGDRNKAIGSEFDLTLTYDYTEDVSFSLLAGWFFPGKYWVSTQDDMATDVVGTVKVAF